MYPHFIGIGAQKAGTTWLDRNLECHPGIWMPPRKEIHYFDRPADFVDPPQKKNRSAFKKDRRKLSVARLREYLWTRRFRSTPRTDRWYASLFRPGRGQVAGEITPEYAILSREKVAHVHRLMPEAKILFVLRNPVERVWSHAVMDFQRKGRNAREMPAEEVLEFARRPYVEPKRDYLKTLEVWGEFYPPERIFVGFMEDINWHPRPFLKEVYGFLGVDPDFRPPAPGKKVNVKSGGSMSTAAARLIAEEYIDTLEALSDCFGGYASFWLYCAERLVEGAWREEEIPNPIAGSTLWEEWRGTLPPENRPESLFMSGSLSGLAYRSGDPGR